MKFTQVSALLATVFAGIAVSAPIPVDYTMAPITTYTVPGATVVLSQHQVVSTSTAFDSNLFVSIVNHVLSQQTQTTMVPTSTIVAVPTPTAAPAPAPETTSTSTSEVPLTTSFSISSTPVAEPTSVAPTLPAPTTSSIPQETPESEGRIAHAAQDDDSEQKNDSPANKDDTEVHDSSAFEGEGTFYAPGLGSCGVDNVDSDMIAAINAPQYGNGPNPNAADVCGRCAVVKGPLGSVKVKITDRCPACSHGDLDLSPAAYNKIADPDAGRVRISWSFASC